MEAKTRDGAYLGGLGANAAELARQFADRPRDEFVPSVAVSPLDNGAYVLELLFTDDHLHDVGERLGRICLSKFHHWSQNREYTQGVMEGLVEMYAVSEVPPLTEWRRVRIAGPRRRKLPYRPVAVMSFHPANRNFGQVSGWRNEYAFKEPHVHAVLEAQVIIQRGR